MEEHEFKCPYCGAAISVVLDISVNDQQYIEDCEVCCSPIRISYQVTEGEVTLFSAIQQE